MKCKYCNEEMCATDYGYYCDNTDCQAYDLDIFTYVNAEGKISICGRE